MKNFRALIKPLTYELSTHNNTNEKKSYLKITDKLKLGL